jgi:uncharacterized heparinase superfamily protein
MIAGRLWRRLSAMDREELRFRAATTLRREASRLAFSRRRPVWRREDLAAALRAGDPVMAPAVAALKQGDWAGAHHVLMRHFTTRLPRFVIAPSSRESLGAALRTSFPTAAVDAADRAGRAIAGQFDLLGYRSLSFSAPGGIDWHLDPVHNRRAPDLFWSRVPFLDPATGDHKIIWELNRHQYWIQLGRAYWLSGDRRYRAAFIDHLASWMMENPPLAGVNWASMLELAFRSISWMWALHLFADTDCEDDTPWTVDLLLGLDRQLRLVEQNLSRYFSPNTHLLGEALALYVAGRALPELDRAAVWERTGRQILVDEINSQIRPDGGHVEGSTHYHRYALDFYLLALAIASETGDRGAGHFAGAVRRLARYARTMANDAGKLPMIGDDDGGALFSVSGADLSDVSGSLQIAALLLAEPDLSIGAPAEEALWMTGKLPYAPAVRPCPSKALVHSGYYVSRSDRGDHLTFDAGPHGFLNGGHAHADALSITLSVRGRPLLIDPGTACYTIDPAMRDRFRSSRAHNTLTLDDRSQSIPDGPFHWKSTAQSRVHDWRTENTFDYVEASHDGYAPLVHHRAVLSRPGVWIVVDRLRGAGAPTADAHWHLDPIWSASLAGRNGVVRLDHPDGAVVWLLALDAVCEIFRGSQTPSLGWSAPVYGRLEPATTVRIRKQEDSPFTIVTAIVESPDQPTIEALHVEGPDQPIGLKVTTSAWSDTAIFARPADEASVSGDRWRDGNVVIADRLAWWREERPTPSQRDTPAASAPREDFQSPPPHPIAAAAAASGTHPTRGAR